MTSSKPFLRVSGEPLHPVAKGAFPLERNHSRTSILTLPILGRIDSLRHGFTTRPTGTGIRSGGDLLRELGFAGFRKVRIRQVHGNRILTVRDADEITAEIPEADGVATRLRGTLLVIRTADCLPLVAVDPDRGVIAACHAGWRGTSLGIAGEAVRTLAREFGCRPGGLRFGLGPAIGVCCYRVGEEVREAFHARLPSLSPGVFFRERNRFLYLNLRRASIRQLVDAGVPENNIESVNLCTACHPELFFSRRREGPGPERLHTFIAWDKTSGQPGN